MADVSLSLEMVEDMPGEIAPGVLYVSEEYEIACHRCACGCGNLVYTPLGAAEWIFFNEQGKPSLKPSIGNWTLPCRSHYWIKSGQIFWAPQWSADEIEAGRNAERKRRDDYLLANELDNRRSKKLNWLTGIIRRLIGR